MIHHIAKRQKVDDSTTYEEAVLFNSDTLSKIISYLPSIDLLNLALTSKRFGVFDVDEQSVIKKSAHIIVQDVATEEQLAALPYYEGDSSLADYHYLQLMREPLAFDQLVGAEYVNSGDKSCIRHNGLNSWKTAFSNNILRAGKHYATFVSQSNDDNLMVGVMRPGLANQRANGHPNVKEFYQNVSRHMGQRDCNNSNSNVQCCLYNSSIFNCQCYSSKWDGGLDSGGNETWVGMERVSTGDEIGMLLDLDEGTLSVYKNGRKLGVMKRGLAGEYCWVATIHIGVQVTIKRGTIPTS